jgi:hypothetical protein
MLRLCFNKLAIRGDLKRPLLHYMNSQNQGSVLEVNQRCLHYSPIETDNKIVVGHKMTQVVEKHRQKHMLKQATSQQHALKFSNNKRLLIASSTPQFNHYAGQTYKEFTPRHHLASHSWSSRNSVGKYFTVNPIGGHPSLIDHAKHRAENDEIIEFANFKQLNPVLTELLRLNMAISRPTYIQFLSVGTILQRESHHLLTAETGGGKTLAYLLPLVETCIRTNQFLDQIKVTRSNRQPIGVIMVPTRELAYQVYHMAKTLVSTDKLEIENKALAETHAEYFGYLKKLNIVVDLHPSQLKAKQKIAKEVIESIRDDDDEDDDDEGASDSEQSGKPIDILITLPGQLEKRQRQRYFNGVYLRQMVLDEADTLLDDSFNETSLKALGSFDVNLTLPKLTVTTEKTDSTEHREPPVGESFSVQDEIDEFVKMQVSF